MFFTFKKVLNNRKFFDPLIAKLVMHENLKHKIRSLDSTQQLQNPYNHHFQPKRIKNNLPCLADFLVYFVPFSWQPICPLHLAAKGFILCFQQRKLVVSR